MNGCWEFTFNVTVPDDDGAEQTFACCRVQSGALDSTDPFKGGIRFHPSVSVAHTRELAALMSTKCALHSIPFRGGKGGVAIDPSQWSDGVLERVCRAYVSALVKHALIGPDVDVPAPDMGTTALMMDWMADEYGNAAAVTGKTLRGGGSEMRTEATGHGVGLLTARAVADHMPDLPKTFALQGFGNVGRHAFAYLVRRGWTCVGVADHTGCFRGTVPAALGDEARPRLDAVEGAGLASVSKEAFMASKATVLILAALEGQLTPLLCERLQCSLVVEGANAPCCEGADAALALRGIRLLPDVLVNAGGVIVSYFEWLQNKDSSHWLREEVTARLEATMLATYDNVAADSLENLRARTAAPQ